MRERYTVNDEGRVVRHKRFDPTAIHPDLFSYDDEIRRRYMDNPEEAELDEDYRDPNVCFSRLGYSVPQYSSSTSVHSFEQKFGDCTSSICEALLLKEVAPSIVSISSFIDDKRLFTCSGIVIESTSGSSTILTSACVVAIPNGDGTRTVAENVNIRVRCEDGATIAASLRGCSLHYNVAFLTVEKQHSVVLSLLGKHMESKPNAVFALGRHYITHEFMAATGEIVKKRSTFDCKDLMFSTSKITKCGIGGPLVNSRGDLLGVNFYDEDVTPYLPSSLVLRCWKHIKTYGSTIHLEFGWRISPYTPLHLPLEEGSRKRLKFGENQLFKTDDGRKGLLVEEVARGSRAYKYGIRDGDIILEMFGKPVVTIPVSKNAAALQDKSSLPLEKNHAKAEVKILRQLDHFHLNDKYLTIEDAKLGNSECNRWPLPEMKWKLLPREFTIYSSKGGVRTVGVLGPTIIWC